MHFIKKFSGAGLGIALIATAGIAASHSEKVANAAVNARHAQMQLIAYHTGILGGMAKGEAEYDAEKAKVAAMNLHTAATLDPSSMWVEGTENGTVEGSYAKPEVWTDAEGFASKYEDLQTASAAMMEAAGTDLDALKASMGNLGKACGACHDDYRVPKN